MGSQVIAITCCGHRVRKPHKKVIRAECAAGELEVTTLGKGERG